MNSIVSGFLKLLLSLSVLLLVSNSSYASDVSVMHPHIRAVPHGHPNSAAFMVLKNSSSENRALVKASSKISKAVELHTHVKEGGMMRMRQVEKISIKANSKTILKPGGLHVMFIGLKQSLKVGDKIDLELEFDDGSSIKLKAPVKMVAGMKMHKKNMH